MRVVPYYEKSKRGCQYCLDSGRIRGSSGIRFGCPHDKCPYHVLDKYKTYEEYMTSEDCKILVNAFFQTAASCYEMSNGRVSVKDVFSGACSSLNF